MGISLKNHPIWSPNLGLTSSNENVQSSQENSSHNQEFPLRIYSLF